MPLESGTKELKKYSYYLISDKNPLTTAQRKGSHLECLHGTQCGTSCWVSIVERSFPGQGNLHFSQSKQFCLWAPSEWQQRQWRVVRVTGIFKTTQEYP